MKVPNDVDKIELLIEIARFIKDETEYPNMVRLFKAQIGRRK